MGKKESASAAAGQGIGFVAPSVAVDPALASLFASSSGPIKVPERSAWVSESGSARQPRVTTTAARLLKAHKDDETSSSLSISLTGDNTENSELKREVNTPPRKRQKLHKDEDIESTYLDRLAREDAKDEAKRETNLAKPQKSTFLKEDEAAGSSGESDDGDNKDMDKFSSTNRPEVDLPQHESLAMKDALSDSEKAKRTVFLGNVSTSAIKSKSAKNTLLEHLRTAVKGLPEHKPTHKVESLRFRSTAFVSGAGPKKAAFAKGELMDQTTKSTNAYVVYSTELAAQRAASKLNGTVVLDRHLRADSLATPTKIEHRRCVFVGNLSFVDEETQDLKNDDGSERRPKAKIPADAEEGLWCAFGKAGRVESVRVIRDKETRIGKGFAYVQFFDENAVEAALLMNDKKFPPMLPRKLRVMRAKRSKQKVIGCAASSTNPRQKSAGSQFSKQDKRRGGHGSKTVSAVCAKPRTREGVVFEGHRASKSSRESNVVSKHRKRKHSTSSSKRAATFKAGGWKRRKTSE